MTKRAGAGSEDLVLRTVSLVVQERQEFLVVMNVSAPEWGVQQWVFQGQEFGSDWTHRARQEEQFVTVRVIGR